MASNFFPERRSTGARWLFAADCFATGVAVFVPWSTSLTEIFVLLWLVAFLPTLFLPEALTRSRSSAPPGRFLPIVLCALAAIGMLWATEFRGRSGSADSRNFRG